MKKMNKLIAVLLVLAFILTQNQMVCFAQTKIKQNNTTQTAVKLKDRQLKVGDQISVAIAGKKVKYSCSNTEIAFVNKDGRITGKKPGTVTIYIMNDSGKKYTCKVVVKKKDRMPYLPVALDEVKLISPKLEKETDGKMVYSAVVKNTAKKGNIKKIVYYYSIQVEKIKEVDNDTSEEENIKDTDSEQNNESNQTTTTENIPTTEVEEETKPEEEPDEPKPETIIETKTVTLTANVIKANSQSARVKCEGDVSGNISEMKLEKIQLYAGSAVYTYNANSKKSVLNWGVKDTKAPIFSGWVGKNSYNGKDVYRIYYSDKKNTYNFKQYVSAVDDRDGKVQINVDTSGINWKKEGVYKIKYSATDKAGNTSSTWAKVQVCIPKSAENVADDVLSEIIKPNWSDTKKARAIYTFVKNHCSYVDNGSRSDWRTVGLNGIRYQTGDCYMFYAVSRLLLTRAGIPNIMISRYPVYHGAHHYWNLVYVQGGWYHFDTTPRVRKGYFCLVTDKQLFGYSSGYTFQFKRNAYPDRATIIISRNP